jgi:hypothetical protein
LVVPFNKALVLVFVVANSGYFTVFTPHIYFIIYDMLKRKRIFQTSWKENIPWVEASGRLITLAI